MTYFILYVNLIATEMTEGQLEFMKVGYARVSTEEQNEARQIKAFCELGIEKVFLDKQSGKDTNRPALNDMLKFIRSGDIVIVESISRAARNTRDLLSIVEQINGSGAEFVSLKESIDTHTAAGKFMLTVFAAIAELEREYIRQRQKEGISIAKGERRYKGRKRIDVNDKLLRTECKLWRQGVQTATEAMRKLNLKPNTFYRRVNELGI